MTLPSPPPGSKLKALAIGRGLQNYTCANASTVPTSVGAVATLYDATFLLAFFPKQDSTQILNDLPADLLSYPRDTLENSGLPILGHHYFNILEVPTFDVNAPSGSCVLAGKKVGTLAAPRTSDPGVNGTGKGAVDWLALSATKGSTGFTQGYRVLTAGGKPPATCADQPAAIQVEYASQYWFYG